MSTDRRLAHSSQFCSVEGALLLLSGHLWNFGVLGKIILSGSPFKDVPSTKLFLIQLLMNECITNLETLLIIVGVYILEF